MTVRLPDELERLLVFAPTWLGDAVMATPLLAALRAAYPSAHVDLLLRPGLGAVFSGLDVVDERIEVDWKGVAGPLRAAAALRRLRPDAAILLPSSFRSALAVRLAGVPVRAGFRRDGRGPLLTHGVSIPPADGPVPAITHYLALGRALLGDAGERVDPHPRLALTDDERDAAAQLLADRAGPLVLLVPGASKQRKRWPADRFAALARALVDRDLAGTILVTGGPDERALCAGIVRDAVDDALERRGRIVDLAATATGLGAVKAIVARADLVVTNDTGPRHLAAAFRRPTVALFGPTDPRWTTLAGADEHLVRAQPFLPEELVADDHARACAIDRIPTADVLRIATRRLEQARAAASDG